MATTTTMGRAVDTSLNKLKLFTVTVPVFILCFFPLNCSCSRFSGPGKFHQGGTFTVDYANNTFLKDGKPFRYVSGSFHYTRVHQDYWEDRMKKIRAAGLNAIQTYVPWNAHEKSPGVYTWDGISDLPRFLTLAQKSDLYVLVRMGPYICGEWEFGGFPPWLITEDYDMVLRTDDPAYMKWVNKWFQVLLTKLKPFLYQNGGPVLMVQIENEFGSYFTCDHSYTNSLRDTVVSVMGKDAFIYTTDGSNLVDVTCGKVNNTYLTIDFGTTCKPENCFNVQRYVEPQGPLVNSEYYTGWLDHWGSPHATVQTEAITKNLDIMLAMGANVNMYMFIGGTNFGFTNGANYPPYQAVPTSYDYDAPLTEEADYGDKYLAIRDIVSKYLPLPPGPIPPHVNKTRYGKLPMDFVSTIQDALSVLTPEGPIKSRYPINMETIRFYDGFILYRFNLSKSFPSPTVLSTQGIRDRAMVMVDKKPMGILDRTGSSSVNITGANGQTVDILVENQGRIGFGSQMNFNLKGIIQNVTLAGNVVENWQIFPIHTEHIDKVVKTGSVPKMSDSGSLSTPSIYTGMFQIPAGPYQPQDTFLDPRPFTKGQAIINGFNLGRYWPMRGPQVTLYVPKPVLTTDPSGNRLHLLELEYAPCGAECSVFFNDTSILNATNHEDYNGMALHKFSAKDLIFHRVH